MIKDNNPVIYLSHPYGGLKSNVELAREQIGAINDLFGSKYTYISPLLNFDGIDYSVENYDAQLSQCISLLSRCDGMVVPTKINESLGCLSEVGYAVMNGIPIFRVDTDNNIICTNMNDVNSFLDRVERHAGKTS